MKKKTKKKQTSIAGKFPVARDSHLSISAGNVQQPARNSERTSGVRYGSQLFSCRTKHMG